MRRANFNALVGRFENALTDVAAAIAIKPDEAEYYWIKGITCGTASGPQNTRGYLEQAVEAYGAAIQRKSSEPKYLASRANAFLQLKLSTTRSGTSTPRSRWRPTIPIWWRRGRECRIERTEDVGSNQWVAAGLGGYRVL